MNFYFNSHEESCKYPFGAVEENSFITFKVFCDNLRNDKVILKYYKEDIIGKDVISQPMERIENGFTSKIKVKKKGLYFYWFEIKGEDGSFFYGNSKDSLGGIALYYKEEYELRPFQITCHSYIEESPTWYKEAVFYQIFPDRFFNGNEDGKVDNPKPNSFIYGNWYDSPLYIRGESGEILRWDFHGGNLKGIIKKLKELKDFGIDGIYLNPIFEARSNHRYDTGDYHSIDPMLGNIETFKELCSEAKKLGIRIILDGVFNHTGQDSIYFNSLNTYDSVGAFNSTSSPYYSWYNFKNYPGDYECWWGVKDLPNVNEEDPSFKDFILNKDEGVIAKWLKLGASGWRLDVADELPDKFIKGIRDTINEVRKEEDYVLIGEVWEDASNKIAYSKRREYLLGDELHGVMNYPFKDSIIGYLRGEIRAEDIYRSMMSLKENYPREAFYSNFNSLGTHDTRRIFTELPDMDIYKLAVAMLLTLPGVPSIYYGDEAGLKGERDPYNRATYPWGRENMEIKNHYKEFIDLRKSDQVFTKGEFKPFFKDNIFGYLRYDDNKIYMILINPGERGNVTIDPWDFKLLQPQLTKKETYNLEAKEIKIIKLKG